MNISSRCEYACRALIELARVHHTQAPITATVIAERRRIPEKYLVHILLQMKRVGLIRSLRGAQGGYMLAKPPEKITLLDIVEAIDGPVLQPQAGDREEAKDLEPVWKDAARRVENALRETSLRDIVEQVTASNMYYI